MDSTDSTTKPDASPAAGADDMLAQLAGDEIDRLLAEAETDAPPPVATATATPPPVEPTSIPADDTAGKIAVSPGNVEVSTGAPASAKTAEPPPAVIEKTDAAPAAPMPAAASEPAASDLPPDSAPAADAPKSLLLPLDPADDNRPPSLLSRMLDLIVSPFDAIPDALLNAIGKVAVVTFINAVALMLYVVIVRHHLHHK